MNKLSVAFLALALCLAFPALASAKRDVGPGTCGLDAIHVKEELQQMKMLVKVKGRCIGPAAAQSIVAFQKYRFLSRTGVVTPAVRAQLKNAKRPNFKVKRRSGSATRMEVWLQRQLLVVIRNDRIQRIIPISSGKPGYSTPAGTFSVFRKELNSWSYPYSVWLPWASYFNGGIAFHESDSVPGYPASHGCVRIPAASARYAYRFADYGRKVLVR